MARATPLAAAVLAVVGIMVWRAHGGGGGATTDAQKVRIVTAVYGGAATPGEITSALRSVRQVAARPFPGGYDRDCGPGDSCSFGPAWSDDTTAPNGHNGCDTRDDVLREQLVGVSVIAGTNGCKVAAGTLVDPYTGRLVDFAQRHYDIDIDHVVPLAYAWDMGASGWTQQERELFANDTSMELLASWGPANQTKSDSGPAGWMPPDPTFRCDYVLRFLQVVGHYGLAITSADARSIQRTARECSRPP